MATLFETLQFFDNNGDPLSSGHVYWYSAGTTTPKQTWKDEAETTPHVLAYITLDANGRFPGGACFIRGSYKLVVKNSTETTTYSTIDNINEYNQFDLTGLTATIADLNATHTSRILLTGSPPLTYNVTLADRGKTVVVNAATANATINLPNSITVGDTFRITVKKADATTNTVSIIPYGGQTIEGTTSKVLHDYFDCVDIHSSGSSDWYFTGLINRGPIENISSTTTLNIGDDTKIYNCTTTGGSFIVHLPVCTTVGKGYTVGFKKIDSSANTVTLTPAGSSTIDGLGTYILNTHWQFVQLKTDGQNWYIIDQNNAVSTWTTGDVKTSYNNSQSGWVWMNNGSIGDASSSATSRANADCQALFVWLWNHISDTYCYIGTGASPGAPGNRGASAIADWNAHKHIQLPSVTGRAIVSAGKAINKTWAIGESAGAETHALSIAELAAHTHRYVVTPSGPHGAGHDTPNLFQAPYYENTSSIGSSTPFNILQPGAAMYYLIRL